MSARRKIDGTGEPLARNAAVTGIPPLLSIALRIRAFVSAYSRVIDDDRNAPSETLVLGERENERERLVNDSTERLRYRIEIRSAASAIDRIELKL